MTQHVQVHPGDRDFFVACYQRLHTAIREQCRCRGCGTYCSLTANLCDTCGTQDPVRLPISWGLALLGAGVAAIALGVWIF